MTTGPTFSNDRPLLLRNGWLMHLDPPRFERADLRVESGRITRLGPNLEAAADDEIVDCTAQVIAPALVVGHHHLYSALAPSMPAPPRAPRNFHEILELVWWRLDRALDIEAVELSARVGAAEAARCGVGTIIDHHASPSAIEGSLDAVREGLDRVGLRGVLCYEVTGRNGGDREQRRGIDENVRFARSSGDGRFAGMIGAHAAFTIDDDGLQRIAHASAETGVPVHIHVAEDPCDDKICRSRFGKALMARLEAAGLLAEGNLFAHVTHLSANELKRAAAAGVVFAHNTRSNMNNGVGYAQIARIADNALLGTDGIGSDLFEELRAATFRAHDAGAGIGDDQILGMLARNARYASARLGVRLGVLEVGAEADLMVIQRPASVAPRNTAVTGALLYALASHHVRTVFSAGVPVYANHGVTRVDTARLRIEVADGVDALWERLPDAPGVQPPGPAGEKSPDG